MAVAMRNLHVPLPGPTYAELRAAAERAGRPATELAREAIDRWLAEARRARRQAEILEYAASEAGTAADLAPDLERAGVEVLQGASGGRRSRSARAPGKRRRPH
jgi:hypothetical protein